MFGQRLCHAGAFLFVTLITAASGPRAGAQGLSDGDTALLNRLLGSGVLGAAVAAKPIADPAKLIPLQPGTWTFQVTSGPNQGTNESDTLQPGSEPGQWQYKAGQITIYDLRKGSDGSIVSPSEQDLTQSVLTRYDPPRPVLIPGMQPGAQQTTNLQVNVFNLSDLSTVAHSGSLTLVLTYLGRYQVTVPAGIYSADLIKWQYNGQIGPANVTDVEYRFFAEGVGPVAVIDKESVSAFLVYNSNTKYGKTLSSAGK